MNVYIPGTGFATQGPAPDGFHVPLISEWQGLKTIMDGLSLTTGDNWRINLHMPFAGVRSYSNATVVNQGSSGHYWSCTANTSGASGLYMNSSSVTAGGGAFYRANGFSVRCFKNSFELPTSSWTVINGTLGGAGIFRNQIDGLISVTSDGTNGYTIQDKNLGATTVYNNGDTLSEANCGKYYQWGNNYGFAWTGSVTTSNTKVNTTGYGPGNYYSGSTFILSSSSPYDWSSTQNDNLWGGTDGNIQINTELKNAYIGEVPPLVLQQVFDFTTSDLHGYTNTKDPNNSYGLTINTSGHYCTGDGTGGSGQIWKQISAKRYWGRIKFMVVNQIYGGVIVGGWGYTGTPTQQLCGANPYGQTIHIDSNGVNLNTLSASYSLNTYYYLDGKFDNGNYTCTLYDVNMNKLKEITATNSDTVWRTSGFGGWGGRNSQSCFRIYGYREAYDNN